MKRQNGLSTPAAAGLLLTAMLAMLVTGARWWGFRKDLVIAEKSAATSKDEATQSILSGFSLPMNRDLRICNHTNGQVKITALAASYWGKDGALKQFNSATQGWHVWTVDGGETKMIRFEGNEPWDGSTIFYAAEVERPGGVRSQLTGTSDNLKDGGCATVTKE
jgi:hypothetical protein